MKTLKRILITLVIGLVFVFMVAASKEVFKETEAKVIFHILSDSFFAVGVVITGFGLLVVASNGGAFDMLSYGVSTFFSFFRRSKARKYADFYEYRVAKEKNKHNFGFLLIAGSIIIVIAIIMYVFYNKYSI
jgi:hypothetical protein